MKNFEQILREKLQNHDAGMANGAWEQFAQNLNKPDGFENAIREKVENHDAGMNNGAWEQFEQRLEQLQPASNWKYYLTGGIAAALIGIGFFYFNSPSSETTTSNKNKTVKENKVIANNNTPEVINNNSIAESSSNSNNNVNNNDVVTDNNLVTNDPVVVQHDIKNNHSTVINDVKDVKKDNLVKDNVVKVDKVNDSKPYNNVEVAVTLVKPEFSIESKEVCQNGDLAVKALNNKADYETIWLVNGEEVSTAASTKIVFTKSGAQQVQLAYATNVNGKRTVVESEKTIVNVLTLPTANFEINKTNVEAIPEYTMTPEKVNGAIYMWNFGDGKFSTEEEAMHVYRKRGSYPVSVTVTGKNGCQAKLSSRIEVQADYNLLAPNAFTPGGDGKNETFIPAALTIMNDVKFKMSIFDRTGKKIYETSRIDAPWDGMNATTGTKCSSNAYIWRVELNLPNGTKEEYMGSVTLLE